MKLPLIKPFATALVILVSPVVAHRAYTGNKRHENYRNGLRSVLDEDQIWRRQAPTIAPPPPAAPTNAPLFDGNSIPPLADITSGMPIQNTVAFETTFAPGATPPIRGAPPIPTAPLVIANYPALDLIPSTDSPQVQEWVKVLDGKTIPNISLTVDGSCASDPAAAADTSRCWWTCGECTRPTDIATCPDKLTWGVSFDDGPSQYTPRLLNYLAEQKLKATFFVVGSRVVSNPAILLYEYLSGHELSCHTWSHHPLTTLTNDQIVAEMGWVRQAIHDVTGVTCRTMRPPFGDIDDRVRAVLAAMDMTPIIWTGTTTAQGAVEFDTDDWRIPANQANGTSSFAAFEEILELAATNLPTGFIVLEHDLFQQTVEMGVGYFLPTAIDSTNPKYTLEPVMQCQPNGTSANAYVETFVNTTVVTTTTTTTSASSTSSTSAGASPATNIKKGGNVSVAIPITAGIAGFFLASVAGIYAVRVVLSRRKARATSLGQYAPVRPRSPELY